MDPSKQPLAMWGSSVPLYPSTDINAGLAFDKHSEGFDQYDARLQLDSFDLQYVDDSNNDDNNNDDDNNDICLKHGVGHLNDGYMCDIPKPDDPIVPPDNDEDIEDNVNIIELHHERYHQYFEKVPPLPPPQTPTSPTPKSPSSSSYISIDYSTFVPPSILLSSHFRSLLLTSDYPSLPTPEIDVIMKKTIKRAINDSQFEVKLLLKNDERFKFLEKSHPLNWYYSKCKSLEIERLSSSAKLAAEKLEKLKETDNGLQGLLCDYGSSSSEDSVEPIESQSKLPSSPSSPPSPSSELKRRRLEKARLLSGHFELKALNASKKRKEEEIEGDNDRDDRSKGRGKGRNIPSWMKNEK
ncbi:hypothetical protein TrVE_jg8202 [Triparma verrucosa]|uniref:SURP motif domain-containing protein n=1 Tax=Triparma verrucosa TaxID=1606542 RepID=A0A9W7CAB9_9STRA|nr:hypothetical protein TrVE_jg8202 [Triparma verrucosa]